MIPEKNNLIEPIYTESPATSIEPVVLQQVNTKKSPREWLRDPSFAEDMLYNPADAVIEGKGANSYIRAKNRVQNFRLGEPRRSQEEYQRLMHKGEISADEGDRLYYLVNVLDEKWRNALRGYKGDGTDPNYKRNYEKYTKQRQILVDNYNNWLKAGQVRDQSWGQLRNPLFMLPGAMGETWSENIGTPIREWWDDLDFSGLQNAILTAQIAEAPAVMTASGWRVENDGTVTFGHENEPGVEALRNSLAVIGGTGLAAATAPWWLPYAPQAAASYFGGRAVDEGAKLAGYDDFGDALVTGTGLGSVLEGTGWEQTARDVANWLNPGYFIPTGRAVNAVGSLIDDGINVGSNAAKNAVNNLKTVRIQSPISVTEEVVAPVVVPATSAGVAQMPEHFVSRSWGWRSPFYRKPAPAPAPAPTPTPNPVPPVGGTAAKIEGAGYTFRKSPRELTERGVKVDPEHRRALRKNWKKYSPEYKDAFAAEARKYYDETGEMVSWRNEPVIAERATERLEKMSKLRDDIYYRTYVTKSGKRKNYTKEEIDNFAEELKKYNTEMSFRDPNAQRLNWFYHPVTNTFSSKPAAWAANHPILSKLEALWPLWGATGATVWGRDLLSEDLPEALKSLYVRSEEPKPVETPVEEEPNEFDKPVDGVDTLYVSQQNRKARLKAKKEGK